MMYSNADVDDVVTEITEHAIAIADPQMATTIDKWLTKLTQGDRGLDELNYLRLLQHMMAQRRVTRPFVVPPPDGPLPPLTRYLNPTAGPCDRLESACDRRARTKNGADDASSYGSTDICWGNDMQTETAAADRESYSDATAASGHENDDDDDDDYDDDDAAVASGTFAGLAWTERDGHLAAAGEHWDDAKGGNRDADRFDELCDPCVDGTGPRGRETLGGKPLDAAYKSLLGDCTLPVFTEAEKKTVGPELLNILENVNDNTTIQDFYYQVSQYTCDQGATMMKVAETMVDDFRAFVSDVFESRTEHISDGLSKEQTSLNEKYTYLRDRALNRATVALAFLREAVPVFSWHKYHSEPDAYMKREILRRAPPSSGDPGGAAADGSGTVSQDKYAADGGEDEDEDGAQQQSSFIKKLLYSLNWMRTEVARVDCEGLRLYEQRDRLTAGLVAANEKRAAAQCRATSDIDRYQNELILLRHMSDEKSKIINRLVEAIQLMQDKQPSSSGGGC